MEKRTITLFTVNVGNNNFYETPLVKLCLSTWYRFKEGVENAGYNCEIKLYTNKDDDFIKFSELYPYYKDMIKNTANYSRLADAFRIYILATKPYHFWLDTDVFVGKGFKFKDEFKFGPIFCILYNSNNTEHFEYIWEKYLKGDYSEKVAGHYLIDREVYASLPKNMQTTTGRNTLLHLYYFKAYNNPMVLNQQTWENLPDKTKKDIEEQRIQAVTFNKIKECKKIRIIPKDMRAIKMAEDMMNLDLSLYLTEIDLE